MTMSMLGHTYQWQKYQIQSICVRDKRKIEHLRPDCRELKSEDSTASFPYDEATLTRQLREASSYRCDSIMSTHTLWLTWPLSCLTVTHENLKHREQNNRRVKTVKRITSYWIATGLNFLRLPQCLFPFEWQSEAGHGRSLCGREYRSCCDSGTETHIERAQYKKGAWQ